MHNQQMPSTVKLTPHMSPGHIQAAAYLYGIDAPTLDTARVLELGCGSGDNLLAFAIAYPNAQAVGISLWPEEIEQARQQADRIGVKNLELHAKHFAEIDASYGLFDYILVDDEFTWGPPDVREAILRICRENLAPSGVTYISYNTYPGWKAGDALRDALQLHNHSATSLTEVHSNAPSMLGLLANSLDKQSPDTILLKAAAERIAKHPEYYITKNYLEANNTSFYFLDMANIAMQAGLSYVGDAHPQEELSATYGENVQLNHSVLAIGQAKVMRQQYLDFAVSRDFRRSLFTHQEHAAEIFDAPDLNRISHLYVACSLQRANLTTGTSSKSCGFIDHHKTAFTIVDETTIGICDALGNVWPSTLDFDTLLAYTRNITPEITDEAQLHHNLQRSLETLFKLGVLHYRLAPTVYDCNTSTNVRLTPAYTFDSKLNTISGFNLWHESIEIILSPSERLQLNSLIQQIEPTNNPIEFYQLINKLKHHGLLLGSDSAWISNYTNTLKECIDNDIYCLWQIPFLAMHVAKNLNKSPKTEIINKKHNNKKNPQENIKLKVQTYINQYQFEEAKLLINNLIKKEPTNAVGWELNGHLLNALEKKKESVVSMLKAISLDPENALIYNALAMTSINIFQELWPAAGFKLALLLDSKNPLIWSNYGLWLRKANNSARSEASVRKAIVLKPDYYQAMTNLATMISEQGNISEAIDYYKQVIKNEPYNFTAYTYMLFAMSQDSGITPKDLFEAHREFGKRVESQLMKSLIKAHRNNKDTDRVLRLGFVSGDLYNHPVANFIEPIWESLNKNSFEIYVYNNSAHQDSTTTQLQKYTKKWIEIKGINDSVLATAIQEDKIDILFDLAGHTAHNRLPMFALKPAPIQISWIGYPGTTGLTAMDYYLVNKYQAPEGLLDGQFTEKLIRLSAPATFKPAPNSPEINFLPALANGYITFGSFNRLSKVGEDVFTLWADILRAVPDSRLLLGNVSNRSSLSIKKTFERNGISAERLMLYPRTGIDEYLKLHHQVDLLLDTFPYNGGTTTMYGLWMGLPTLTLAGQILSARTGAAIMHPIGLEQFIVESKDEYLSNAISWDGRLNELASIRAEMRKRLLASPFFSHEKMTTNLELALRKTWQTWCEDKQKSSFEILI